MTPVDPRALERQQGTPLDVIGYRNQAAGFDPRSGEGARRHGGRFNPPQSFAVLYLCLSKPCVVAELARQAVRQGLDVDDLLPRELWQVSVTLAKVLDLTNQATLDDLGLGRTDLVRDDYGVTHQLGVAAYQHGFQAIRVASATAVDEVLAVFPDDLTGAVLTVELIQVWTTVGDLGTAFP